MTRFVFCLLSFAIAMMIAASATAQTYYCEGNEPYAQQNGIKAPGIFGVFLLPGSLIITAVSLNARQAIYDKTGKYVDSRPGCLPYFILRGQARPKSDQ
jgi:hypothetical protein